MAKKVRTSGKGRKCSLCGADGGTPSSIALYHLGITGNGYAHADCLIKARKRYLTPKLPRSNP